MPASGFRRLLIAALMGLALPAAATAAEPSRPPHVVDPELRRLLIEAVNDSDGFVDRFDAEVWLVDMSTRLEKFIADPEERLVLLRHVHREASRAGLMPEIVLAVIEVESRFDRYAISAAGAQGLMQVMPFWLDEIGKPGDSLFNVRTNLRMGCTILRYYLDRENGNITRALMRYNGSLGSHRYTDRVFLALDRHWRLL